MKPNLDELAVRVHEANKKWWQDPATGEPIERNQGEMLMLMVSELSEAMEGARKDLMDDHLPHRKMEEVELADFMVRLLDFAGGWGYGFSAVSGANWRPGKNKGEDLLKIVTAVCKVQQAVTAPQVSYCLVTMAEMAMTYADVYGLDVWAAFEEKMAYNAVRRDHTHEARLAEGGKKW